MSLMSVSQYAKHAGMSRQALYSWESKSGFPARIGSKIDAIACDAYLSRYRDSHDPRAQNAKSKPAPAKGKVKAGTKLVEMSVAEIRQHLDGCIGKAAEMDADERAAMAAKAVGLYLSEGPDNPPVTFGGYRLSIIETPEWETGQIIAGGAFGLSAIDVVYECLDYTLTLMSDEIEETAMREVIPSLLYVLGNDE
ncbi:hypothetical protein N4224_02145 [Yersinia enterocolitica]|uniref:hypothetical protein n=1 Tax=Yersinia TaxID=629 RepID=UPI0021E7C428|nr:hypothetical protein [Yersinia enterocolitica]UYJ85544.1 hypothetical protein N4W04_02140 [Yersinia enterocolitica]UYK14926.1 hypothetical protein N4224_02145 [Yersinia enterocolitica]HDL6617342.1 hypothetical protein [Yersinia enterocolitica]HDL6701486.1 hypothetical protein [Yersinia enterocolitica]HDL7018204.1 hypothetical protein [Yersinia enterocolitica]